MSGESEEIIIKEIKYKVKKEQMIEKMEEMVREKRIDGI